MKYFLFLFMINSTNGLFTLEINSLSFLKKNCSYFILGTSCFDHCLFCTNYLILIMSIFESGLNISNLNKNIQNHKVMHTSLTMIVIRRVKYYLFTTIKSKLLVKNLRVITNFILFSEKLLFHMQVSNMLNRVFFIHYIFL